MSPTPDERDESKPESELAPTPKPMLLLVEDDWRSHSALRKIFTKLGWEVRSAMTVAGGIAMLEMKPRALILDMMLPDGDGLEVLRRVRSERLPIQVIVTTGIEDRKRLELITSLRPDALFRKPIDLDQIFGVLGLKLLK